MEIIAIISSNTDSWQTEGDGEDDEALNREWNS